jgi:hypothetical protein
MWAGLTQITGPSTDPGISGLMSAQNGWAKLGPTYFSSCFVFGNGLDLAQLTRLG